MGGENPGSGRSVKAGDRNLVGYYSERAGEYEIRGTVKFSVCSDSKCLLKKRAFQTKLKAD